jgi:hypothetical protein
VLFADQMARMISFVDICGLCGLDLDQIEAIGEHEHLPDVAAAALASYLLRSRHGLETVRTMIVDDVRLALTRGKKRHAQELIMALRHLYEQHPELAE